MLLLASCLSFFCPAQSAYYYGKKGEKMIGEIDFHHPKLQANGSLKPAYLTFRAFNQSKREKLSLEDLSAFVMGIDSFTVINHLKVQQNQTQAGADLVQVLEKGKMNLYLHESSQGKANKKVYKETYILSLAGSKTYLCLYELSKQVNQLASLFEANPRFQKLILAHKLKVQDIPQLVRAYNASYK